MTGISIVGAEIVGCGPEFFVELAEKGLGGGVGHVEGKAETIGGNPKIQTIQKES
jgi:hypothetical protein